MTYYKLGDRIATFPPEIRKGIKEAVTRKLKKTGLPDSIIRTAVSRAMDSRLIDLEDTINVGYWLNKANRM